MHRTGIETMSIAWKAALLPLHQLYWEILRWKRWITEVSNIDFSLQIVWVSHKKKPKLLFEKRSIFSLTRLISFSLFESCCFWFVTSRGHWEVKKRQEFTILWMFCPSNAHNSIVQSFPENIHSFIGRLSLRIVPESKPFQQLGRLRCYHYTNDTEKVYDWRDEFQKFQTLIFPYKLSECHIKKKPKLLFEKRSSFFANQTNLFLINRKLLFLICYFLRSLGSQKTTWIFYFMIVLSL